MGAKNKGGREVRKPKKDKKAKTTTLTNTGIAATVRRAGEPPAK